MSFISSRSGSNPATATIYMKKNLYEILVPTMYGMPEVKPIRTKHHKEWDKKVQQITGGLTILSPGIGKWTYKGVEYPERVIPVRIICTYFEILKIVDMTIKHYRQKAVMHYLVSSDVNITYAPGYEESTNGEAGKA